MAACILCGGSQWKTLETAESTRLVRCACGLVFVTPQPPRSILEQLYDEAYYQPWHRQARLRSRIWRGRANWLAALAPLSGRLLDVGCGTGDFLEQVRTRGWDAAGTELSRAGAKIARAQGFEVAEGEIWEAKFPAAAFDVVTCWHVIEHVSDPRRVLGEIYRILRTGGLLVLATPNLRDYVYRTGYTTARGRLPRLYEPTQREQHLFIFSAETLQRLVASVGFTQVRVGFDRGAAAEWHKFLLNELAYAWYRLTRINWGMALELVGRKPIGLP